MCAERSTRAFGFGCRETPDIYNKFLEQLGFYRKHTAVDSTSLYRVVSELCYDIQVYHFKVRMECVKFMRNNRGIFAKDIKFGYDSYVNNLARPRTYGSLLELKALALRYKANVFVFEPLTHGKWYIYNPKYKTTWRIYVGRNNHFDAVYSLEYIKQAAECQSIVYQLLYKNVLGLPDVEYAVERMLHDPEGKHITYETNEEGITTASTPDGLQMPLSKRSDTQCVLIYSHLCHFHNQYNFGLIEEFFSRYGSDEGCRVYIGNYFQGKTGKPNPLLTDANISCVRQLLALGITPFPYKVAKSLDPCIYRNVEYDVWQEERLARNREELEIEKRLQNEKVAKRAQHINRLALAKKASHERACQQIVAHYIPPAIVDATAQAVSVEPLKHADVYPSTDPQHVLQSYQLQPFYIPSSDPYAVNTYSVLPSEPNHGTFAENGAHPIGVQGCIYNPFTTPPPLQFHASAQSPLTYFQQTPDVLLDMFT
uniref:OTU domain-containing protein n=1 Tax=Anopheles minimus TaxID=112268 RepID=A0A182W5E5_9DIPT